MQFSAADNPFGLGTSVLAGAVPKLIDTRGDFGTNLGVALGGTLLTALMGYQARQTAADLTSRATKVGLDILSAETPEQKLAIAEQADQGWYGSEMKSKAMNLIQALEGQKKVNEIAAQQAYNTKVKELEALTGPAGTKYVGLQTQKMLEGIEARGQETRLTDAQKQVYKQNNMLLASDIKANQGWLKNDQKIDLEKRLEQAAMERLKTGADSELVRNQMLADYKAAIDKSRMDAKQANDLQKLEFKNQLDQFAKSTALPPKQKEELDSNVLTQAEAYNLANYIEENYKSYAGLKIALNASMADDNSLKERVNMFQGELQKAMTGLAASIPEIKRWTETVKGDITASPEDIVANLRMIGDKVGQKSLITLSQYSQSPTQIYNTIANMTASKEPLILPALKEASQRPEVPAPASQGMSLAAGLAKQEVDQQMTPEEKSLALSALLKEEQDLIAAKNSNKIDLPTAAREAARIIEKKRLLGG